MKCYTCGGVYTEIKGVKFRIDDKLIGTFYVENISYLECKKCNDRLFDPKEVKKIEIARKERLEQVLQKIPIGEYLTASKTAEMLGITRQALNKHRRISRGFIYQIDFGGKKVYLKKSVDRFRTKDDGRFVLCEPDVVPITYADMIPEIDKLAPLTWFHSKQSNPVKVGFMDSPHFAGSFNTKEVTHAISQ
jgi:hypothetical protein